MRRFTRHKDAKDLRENGRIILAHGEVTGHMHEVCAADGLEHGVPPAEFFEEPDGRRVLLSLSPRPFVHPEHGRILLDPAAAERGAILLKRGAPGEMAIPGQYRQGDVLLHPLGFGAWEVRRQEERRPDGWRAVVD